MYIYHHIITKLNIFFNWQIKELNNLNPKRRKKNTDYSTKVCKYNEKNSATYKSVSKHTTHCETHCS